MKRNCLGIGMLCLLLLGSNACSEDPPLRLSHVHRRTVDSLYKQYVDSAGPVLDSLCRVRFDSVVATRTDSLVQKRREEEARLRKRIPRE